MKTVGLLFTYLWLLIPAVGQERGHYDLISVNEAIQGEGYTVSILSWERQKIEVTVEKEAGTPLEIRVRSSDRQLLSSDKAIRLDQIYRRIINLSQLESGRYWLEIQVGKQLIRREVWLETTARTYQSLTLH